ncbi:hypothetical protein GCM10007916_28810 [Psychromonas marina]|uniref:Prepilin peptidase A24 N-terminal domain-containing protein n=1 Tax=Psychromonas marina TaxID=88364 RepID=A0ABQ6E326_9GAMM|nr:hypothetical protein GCM10007916_28810 [Psychromonas marina]
MQIFNEVQYYIWLFFWGYTGALLGGFYGVLYFRLENVTKRKIANSLREWMAVLMTSSECDYCNIQLKWYHYWPIFGYVFLGGKTKCCNETIPVKYFLFELCGMCIFLSVFVLTY